MTVSTETSRVDYTGNGVTVTFSVPFPFIQNDYLYVLRTDLTTLVSTELVLDSAGVNGYTVSGAGGSSGSITVVTAPTSNERLSIIREVPSTQEADFVANDPFPAETFESALDKLSMICGQLITLIARALTLFPGDSTAPGSQGRYNANSGRIINLADAEQSTDAVNLQQVNALIDGVSGTSRYRVVTFQCPASPDSSYDILFGFQPSAVQIVATLSSATQSSSSTAFIQDGEAGTSVSWTYADGTDFISGGDATGVAPFPVWAVVGTGGGFVSDALLVNFNESGITVNITTADPNVIVQCIAFR